MKYLVYISFLSLIGCSTNTSELPLSDEAHRPSDWSTEIEIELAFDTVANEIERHSVLQFHSTNQIESLIEQVWKMAFSGDAQVYGINAFGEMDLSKKLSPEELLELLKELDTLTIEDLHTGEYVDTVIDLSFDLKSVSAFVVFSKFGLGKDGNLIAQPYALSIGKQVFEESSGEFRGIANKFFVNLKTSDEAIAGSCDQRICFLTDSLGLMRSSYWDFYQGSMNTPFETLIRKTQGSQNSMLLNFNLSMGYVDQQMHLKFKEIEKEA